MSKISSTAMPEPPPPIGPQREMANANNGPNEANQPSNPAEAIYDSDLDHPLGQSLPSGQMPPPQPQCHQRHRPSGGQQSRSSICSSDGFSSSFESLPLPGQLQRTPVMEFGQSGAQPHLRVPDDPGGQPLASMGSSVAMAQPQKGWDTFRLLPPKPDRRGRGTLYISCLQLLKLCTFVALLLLTLATSILAKSAFLLMAAGLGQAGQNVSICPDKIPESISNRVFIPPRNAAKWAWALLLALSLPEWLCFARSLHRSLFRKVRAPSCLQFMMVFTVESAHAFGLGALVFAVMPHASVITMLQFGNALCLVPALLTALSRPASRWLPLLLLLDLSAVLAQSSAFWAGPMAFDRLGFAFLCAALISAAWWQNFVHPHSFLGAIRMLSYFAARLRECRSKTYVVVSPWKCFIFTVCMFQFVPPNVPLRDLLQKDPFGERLITINAERLNQSQLQAFQERMQDLQQMTYRMPATSKKANKPRIVEEIADGELLLNKTNGKSAKMGSKKMKPGAKLEKEEPDLRKRESRSTRQQRQYGGRGSRFEPEEETVAAYNIYDDRVELNQFTTPYDAIWMALFQAGCALLCQMSTKFACKVVMQRMGMALPMLLSIPLNLFFMIHSCKRRAQNPCYLSEWISKELFWQCPNRTLHWQSMWMESQNLLWLGWLLAQFWITIHLWMPRQERLAKSEKLFVLGYFDGPFPEQSLALDRRRDDKIRIRSEDIDTDDEDDGSSSTRTYESGISDGAGSNQSNKTPSICSSLSSSRAEFGLIREQPSSADGICKIYVCATMWHESALEMTCMLKSIFRMDEDQCARRNAQRYLKVVDPDYYEFEAHIYLDDAFELDAQGNPQPNKFVHQLLEKMDEAASSVHQTELQLRTPKICATPYGGRIGYVLPGRNRLTVHLKNKWLIRQRKRWSQVMYLYYLLGYRLMLRVHDQRRRDLLAENTFILTLDGDVDFQPDCVHLLVDLMRKNRRLGAACGRIHPRGSGLMVWYQKFEYAIGHWLQKSTEHMIGCVLCSPGCFSLFRSAALIDDNVARKYATQSDKPVHYVQYDQGEDRWLCTLLLQRGYRVEYCAASDALTFAPEGFTEFFNQRRRWIPSTMANIIDLLRDYRNVVKVNESVSIWYIAYQLVMLFSSVLGPGTIFLMIVGAISISFNIDTRWALLIMTSPVLCFCICCLTCSTQKQLILAQIIGALFAMLMTAVIVGTSLQIQKDGILSPHSLFLFTVLGSWFIAAFLHPLEFSCVLPCALYFLAIPCMYMLLPIYSLCNLNTVAWGTRENVSSARREQNSPSNGHQEEDGELSVGCGNFCRVVCCVRNSGPAQVRRLDEGLREIERKLESLERKTNNGGKGGMRGKGGGGGGGAKDGRQSAIGGGNKTPNEEQPQKPMDLNGWMETEPFRRFENVFIDPDEESFWRELIQKYLKPIHTDPQEQDRVQNGLNELRNKCCSAFFMVNIVFIIVVLVLQMQKDCLHIEWPLGPLVNQTRVQCGIETTDEEWVMSRLQLEPMGFVFIVFFLVILLIQFLAMLFHRFGTMAHIIASTELCCSRRTIDKLSEEELMAQNAVEIARELQAIRGLDGLIENEQQFSQQSQQQQFPPINGQQPCQMLDPPICPRPHPKRQQQMNGGGKKDQTQQQKQKPPQTADTLDAAFRKRFFALSSSSIDQQVKQPHQHKGGTTGSSAAGGVGGKSLTLNRKTLKALEHRRESIYGRDGAGLKRLSAPPNQINVVSSDSDGENPNANNNNRRQRVEGPSRCHRLEELFKKNRKGEKSNSGPTMKNSWF